MSRPSQPEDVKLIASLFSRNEGLIDQVISEMQSMFGPTDWISPGLFFDRTRYYVSEMGWPLYRRFIAFQNLIRPEALVAVKLETNHLEKKHLESGKREINIDPGYISLERVVLATGKNYTHRIYLSSGVYADLTLVFHKGAFQTLNWTYPDYAAPETIGFFNDLREKYKRQIRGINE